MRTSPALCALRGATIAAVIALAEPGTVTFQVGSHSYYYGTSYEVIEELDSSTFLAITGHVISTFAEGRISGALHGSIETLRPATGGLEKIATCQSATHAHPFELSR